MKNLLIYLMLATILIVTGCKKDNNDNHEPEYEYRLIELTSSTQRSNEDIVIFTYNDSDKVSSWLGIYDGVEEYKAEVVYPNENTVEFLLYDIFNGVNELEEKIVYTFDNNQNISMVMGYYSNGTQLIIDYKSTFFYNTDGNVIQTNYYEIDDGNEELSSKNDFTYNGSLLLEHTIFLYNGASLVPILKTTYNHDNGLLNNSIDSYFDNNEWNESNKNEFFYNNDAVEVINSYTNSGGNAWEISYTTNYTYDDDGNMVSSEEESSFGYSYLESYTYEQKSGNLSIFDFYNNYGYPNPIYNPNPKGNYILRNILKNK
ncbi:MAG: hypothetical protein QM503_02830 [Bacteroidota bacterium]